MTDFEKTLSLTPSSIEHPNWTGSPNEPVQIYKGTFFLRTSEEKILVHGKMEYRWTPTLGAFFYGHIEDATMEVLFSEENYTIFVEDDKIGKGFLLHQKGKEIEGVFSGSCVYGDSSINVDEVIFVIPNMRNFHSGRVKKENTLYRGRVSSETSDFSLTISKAVDYRTRIDALKSHGGFHTLYTGRMKWASGKNLRGARKELEIVNNFLCFINGRKTSAIFLLGCHEKQVLWQDFSGGQIDVYTRHRVQTWTYENISEQALVEIHQSIRKLCSEPENKDFLNSALGWYLEANNRPINNASSMILVQTTLELLYNWLIVEKEKIIKGNDKENISASNKIRLLLNKIEVPFLTPDEMPKTKKYIRENNLEDAVDAIVEYRNAIVHSQKKKRKLISKLSSELKHELLELALWYTELSLLYILEYNGTYHNRCSGIYEKVPWQKKD